MKLQKELLNQMADQHKLLLRISCFCVAMSKCLTRTSVRWFDFAEFCGGIQSTEVWGVYHHNRGSWLRYACSQERTADRKRDRARKLPIHTKWPILSGWLSLLKIPEPSTAKSTHRNRVQTHQSSGSCHIQSTARINRHFFYFILSMQSCPHLRRVGMPIGTTNGAAIDHRAGLTGGWPETSPLLMASSYFFHTAGKKRHKTKEKSHSQCIQFSKLTLCETAFSGLS